MNLSLTIDMTGLQPAERQRVLSVVETVRRNRTIREHYAGLQPGIGKWQAIARLSQEYSLSERQIRRILYAS